MSTWKKCLTLGLFIPIILAFISCSASSEGQFDSPITGTQDADEPQGTPGLSNNQAVDPNVQVGNIPANPPPPILIPPPMGFPAVSVSDRHGRDDGGDDDDDFCRADADCPRDFICVDDFCRASGELVSINISVAIQTSIALGTQLQLIAIGTYINGSTEDITSSVLWSSSNTAVAIVSNAPGSQGLVTSIAVGFTEITAALGAISASFPLTVTSPVLVSIEVTPTNPSIANGLTGQFTATGFFSDDTTHDLSSQVAWSSSMSGVATVSNAEGTQGLATGLSLGTSIITATLDAISGNTTLTVTNPVLVSLALTPPNPSIAAGTTQQFIATGTFSDGTTEDLTTSVSWASSVPGIATISNAAGSNGLATSVGSGSTSISATFEAVSGSTTLTTLTTSLYAILDVGTVGSIIHNVVSIDYSDPNNISYVPFGTIAGYADKYFISATLDPASSKIFVALSDFDSSTSVDNMYLYSVTFPDLLTVSPFSVNNTIYINLNPQVTYNVANNLFYYAVNNDPSGYDYKVNTIDSSGNITVTSINTSNLQNSGNGLQIFNNFIYATYRPGNSFTVDFAGINNNTTGSIISPITPQPPGQLWSVFDLNGVLWGTTQFASSSLPSYSLYKLQSTTGGLPASSPFPSELVGNMPTTFENNFIANITLFTPALLIRSFSAELP